MGSILSKSQSTTLYGLGLYGNGLRQWDSLDALDRDGFVYPIVIRYRHPNGGNGPCIYHIHRIHIDYVLAAIESSGWKLDYVYFNEGTPDHRSILHAELCEYPAGTLNLKYSVVKTHSRESLKHSREIQGRLSILDFLSRYLSDASYLDLLDIIEEYPFHTIEFTAFDHYIGNGKARNTIIWEVRLF